jgi:hypothetical protein
MEELVDLWGQEQRSAHDLADGAIDDHLAIAQQYNAIGAVGHKFHIVCGQDNGSAPSSFLLEKSHQ